MTEKEKFIFKLTGFDNRYGNEIYYHICSSVRVYNTKIYGKTEAPYHNNYIDFYSWDPEMTEEKLIEILYQIVNDYLGRESNYIKENSRYYIGGLINIILPFLDVIDQLNIPKNPLTEEIRKKAKEIIARPFIRSEIIERGENGDEYRDYITSIEHKKNWNHGRESAEIYWYDEPLH